MSSDKLEALMWNELDDSPVCLPGVYYFHLTKVEAKECNRRARAAHALGVEDGKRCAPEAAPVGDGRRWTLWLAKLGHRSNDYPGEYSTAEVNAIKTVVALVSNTEYEARPVEPKHVHEWSIGSFHCPKVGPWTVERTCSCNARQVAEWKNEP